MVFWPPGRAERRVTCPPGVVRMTQVHALAFVPDVAPVVMVSIPTEHSRSKANA